MTQTSDKERLALEYSGYEPNEPLNGLNLMARDQYVGFLAGYDAGLKEVEALVEAANEMYWATANPDFPAIPDKYYHHLLNLLNALDAHKARLGKG